MGIDESNGPLLEVHFRVINLVPMIRRPTDSWEKIQEPLCRGSFRDNDVGEDQKNDGEDLEGDGVHVDRDV
jgi:hypothetical protein